MRFGKNSLAAVAAAGLVLAPIAAQAAPAASQVDRAAAKAKSESELKGGIGIFLALLAVAAIVAGIVIAADNKEDTPTSP